MRYCEDMCQTCIYNKYDCRYMMGGNVGAGYNDKGEGIIITCDNYEKDKGQDKQENSTSAANSSIVIN